MSTPIFKPGLHLDVNYTPVEFHEPVPWLFGYCPILDLAAWRTGTVDGTVSPGLCLLRHVKEEGKIDLRAVDC